MRFLSYVLFSILSLGVVASPYQNTSFAKLKFSELSDNSLSSTSQFKQIVKDARGVFWFATNDGLYSYDGYNFTSHKKDYSRINGSLIDDTVYSLATKGNNVYVGSSSAFHTIINGVITPYVSNDENLIRYIGEELNYVVSDELPEESVRTLKKLNDGSMWLGLERTIVKYNDKDKSFIAHNVTENLTLMSNSSEAVSLEITGIVTTNETQFWLSTANHGLIKYDATTKQSEQILDLSINKIEFFGFSNILLGTDQGLKVFDIKNESLVKDHFLTEISDPVGGLFVTDSGEVWVGSNSVYHVVGRSVTKYEPRKDFKINSVDPKVGEIFVDEQNTVIVCFDNLGVFRASSLTSKALLVNDIEGTSNSVTAIRSSSRQGVFLGFTKGLAKAEMDGHKLSYSVLKKQNGDGFANIRDIHLGISDQVWIAEDNEITLYQNNSTKTYSVGEQYTKVKYIYKLVQDYNGIVWFTVSRNGIFKLDPITGSITRESGLSELRLFRWLKIVPIIDRDRKIITFIKSKRGFIEFDIKNSKIFREYKDQALEKHYERALPFRESSSWYVFQSSNERFWITHAEKYLSTFDPISGKGETLDTPLSRPFIGVSVHKGKLWLAEENGDVFIWEKSTGLVSTMGSDEGLPESGVTGWSVDRHKDVFLFGSKEGLVVLPSNNSLSEIQAPKTFISSMIINNKFSHSVGLDKRPKIELTADQSVVTFRFFTSGTSSPDTASYRFRLRGSHEDWYFKDSSQRIAHYTNLSAGEYVFEVQSKEKLGNWGASSLVPFSIEPSVWDTLWAKIFYLLMLFSVIYLGYRVRVKSIKKRNFELENLVQQKTTELTHLLEFKNHFVLDLTHELKTMLHVQSGEYETLFEFLESHPGYDTGLLKRSSKRMNRLIDQLLALAALQGGASLKLETVNLTKLVSVTLPYFKNMANDFNVELQSAFDDGDLYANVDSQTIERVVTNLVGNGIKYNRKNGTVKVRVFREGGDVVLIVADTGMGIPAEKIPEGICKEVGKVVVQSKNNRLIGHGIGLNLISKAVELNGGTLQLKTDMGLGTVFRVTFPTVVKPLDEIEVERESDVRMINLELDAAVSDEEVISKIEKQLVRNDENATVLIVDDNIDVLSGLAPKLNEHFNIALALSGEDGFEKAQEICPDLILTDLNMPGISGFELLKQVKSNPTLGHIPVLILTAMTDKDIHVTGIELGADDTICKPIKSIDLIKRISNRLEANRLLYEHFRKEYPSKATRQAVTLKTNNSTYSLERQNANQWLEKLNNYIKANLLNKSLLRVSEVSRYMECPQSVVTSKLKTLTAIHGIKAYIRDYRLQLAHEELKRGTVGKLEFFAQEFGFAGDEFSRFYKAKYGVPPSKTKKEAS